jgi:hypothetical protein
LDCLCVLRICSLHLFILSVGFFFTYIRSFI